MPIDPKALAKAESRLRVAAKAIADLPNCKTKNEFNDTWYVFLVAAKNVYTTLEQGAKTDAAARQWFGAKGAERRGDELLQYLFQARDVDEHGLEAIAELIPEVLGVGKKAPGFSNDVSFSGTIDMREGGNGINLTVQSNDRKPILIEWAPSRMRLSTVTGRGHVKYPPPKHHKSAALHDTSPLAVATLGLVHLEALVAEAKGLT